MKSVRQGLSILLLLIALFLIIVLLYPDEQSNNESIGFSNRLQLSTEILDSFA